MEERGALEHLESYLARRDGVDKLLKIARYASKLALAAPRSPTGAIGERLRAFEASVGTSRKAFRLGKFIQDVNALIKAREAHRRGHGGGSIKMLLELVAYGGEGVYFFVEQFIWLTKAGLIDKRNANALQKVSAWAEFIGYFGSVALKYMELSAMIRKETRLMEARHKKADDGEIVQQQEQEKEIKSLREKKLMKSLSLAQDFADSLLALSDIRDGRGRLSAPFLLASAGLVSALISTHKNWISC